MLNLSLQCKRKETQEWKCTCRDRIIWVVVPPCDYCEPSSSFSKMFFDHSERDVLFNYFFVCLTNFLKVLHSGIRGMVKDLTKDLSLSYLIKVKSNVEEYQIPEICKNNPLNLT